MDTYLNGFPADQGHLKLTPFKKSLNTVCKNNISISTSSSELSAVSAPRNT